MKKENVYVYCQDKEKIGYDHIDEKCFEIINEAVSMVEPGNKVVIKPNLVRQSSLESNEWIQIITNPSLIREVLCAVINKMDNKGEIIILDGPQEDSDYEKIIRNLGLKKIVKELQEKTRVIISFVDIRIERKKTCNGIIVKRIKQPGDPKGYVKVDLAGNSSFADKENKDYYGADYDRNAAREYHNDMNNSYIISGSVLDCDVYINMPKWKTHKIGGMTCCLKNTVGIIGVKNCIPHHTLGSPQTNGDAYPEINDKIKTENRLKLFAHRLLNNNIPFVGYAVALGKYLMGPFLGKPMQTIRSGHWYGNDTLWRAILDLNKILIYADKNGIMHDEPQRKYVSVIDGIIAGEKNGPMMAKPKKCGVVAIAYSPLLGDTVMAVLMGFDYNRIPYIREGYKLKQYALNDGVSAEGIEICSNEEKWNKKIIEIKEKDVFHFEPAFGWRGHIENNDVREEKDNLR